MSNQVEDCSNFVPFLGKLNFTPLDADKKEWTLTNVTLPKFIKGAEFDIKKDLNDFLFKIDFNLRILLFNFGKKKQKLF